MTWPIGSGKRFRGVYRLYDDTIHLFAGRPGNSDEEDTFVNGLHSDAADLALGDMVADLRDELELVQGASNQFDLELYLAGELTPVFFGSAIANLGVDELMVNFAEHAPAPQGRAAESREVASDEGKFSGFVFKIQANMDPSHHDRIAFMRITSGQFIKGKKLRHVRLKRDMAINNASSFMASRRDQAEEAWAGDILGVHNHGTIQIGDTFTEGEELKFTGIPNFAPELFRRVRLQDPLRAKALQKGLIQLSEEGATQVFRPLISNDMILGAVGVLQFDVVAHRLKTEYKVECSFEPVQVATARWLHFPDAKTESDFRRKNEVNLATDGSGALTYVAPNMVNLQLTMERWPDVEFRETREI
jgi:peptide chain release factor 3